MQVSYVSFSTPNPVVPRFGHRMFIFAAKQSTAAKKSSMYDVLSVRESAGQDEIKAAFRKLARRWHPDTCGMQDRDYYTRQFIQAREAYRVLSDPVLRDNYDYRLVNGVDKVFTSKKGRKEAGFGNWESQLEGLRKKSSSRAATSSWGCRMRATQASASNP